LIAILGKEKYIAEEEEKREKMVCLFAISSLISHLSKHLKSHSGIKEEEL
jgi:hypothetical protein